MSNEPIHFTNPGITLQVGGSRQVLIITSDGRLVAGEGLSQDEASQEAFRCLTEVFKFDWDTRAELEKENELLRTKVLEMDQTIFNLRYPGIKISGLPQ